MVGLQVPTGILLSTSFEGAHAGRVLVARGADLLMHCCTGCSRAVYHWMVNIPSPAELAQIRLDNALALFEEFVRLTARQADVAALRGLERRFAEQVDIQPSYWSQIKSRSRQIGERLARQFEQRCQKPAGWMDRRHDASAPPQAAEPPDTPGPRDDDERFIVGLVLTYYRRHPQRARTRLLDLLGEVLTPAPEGSPSADPARRSSRTAATTAPSPAARAGAPADELWLRTRAGVAPLSRKR